LHFVISICQLQQKQSFAFRLVHLNGDAPVHPVASQFAKQVLGQKVSTQHRHIVANPAMAMSVVYPEVLVSVDDHYWYQLRRLLKPPSIK